MPDLFLELFSEEIPARMQAKAEADLKSAIMDGLKAAGLEGGVATAISGPRRLALNVSGLPARSPDVTEERKGPKVGAPDKAVEGFLRGAGLASIDEAEVRNDPKKGDFYVALREIPGRPLQEIVAGLVPEVIRGFHWPKSMRWGPNSTSKGELRWVRPLQRITCLVDGNVVDFEVDGIASANLVEGHRVHGRGPFEVTGFDDYVSTLQGEGNIVLSRTDRRLLIEEQAQTLCLVNGLELVEDKGLLEEVTGLAEWPVVILGQMDPAFLNLPDEVIQLSMRTHQKYFAVNDPKTGTLAPNFIVVANIEARDGGTAIAEGNSRVLSARLDDARFFWEQDRATPLETMAKKLSTIDFKKELGTIADKVERVAALARELAPKVGADRDIAERAAHLAKADLVSGMVGEFPELQGVMGRYYVLERLNNVIPDAKRSGTQGGQPGAPEAGSRTGSGEPSGMTDLLAGLQEADIRAIANAVGDHYKPAGPSDAVPLEPVAIAVALADKLDTLVGFWAIDEKPTGSKDPFALRRAALGVVRIILENGVRLGMREVAFVALQLVHETLFKLAFGEKLTAVPEERKVELRVLREKSLAKYRQIQAALERVETSNRSSAALSEAVETIAEISDLLAFFADRLKQYLRDAGARYDLIDAVFALGEDDLVLIVKRVEALAAFLETEDGANLLAGYKRAANILKAEEKQDGAAIEGDVDPSLFEQDEERALHTAIKTATARADAALKAEDFAAAMAALAELRGPVYAFFDGVTVNADAPELRANRLRLLSSIRAALHRVADFSKIAG